MENRNEEDLSHAKRTAYHYQDDANQRRWALKLKDTQTIAQIDAVFVTVGPEAGSTQPTGKPLLFT